jgi:hypothetical protein
VRCEVGNGLREAIDKSRKKDITEGEIRQSMATNESGQRSYFSAKPTAGFDQAVRFMPRPEIEQRPESGDKSFLSVFAFDGTAPEAINSRLAILGMVWAFTVKKATGLTVAEQLFNPATSGLVYFVGTVRVVTATDGQTRPSVTSDKVLVRQIRVNAMLTSDKVKPELLCPRWLPCRCHVGWLDVLPLYCTGCRAHSSMEGANGCHRGAYGQRVGRIQMKERHERMK